MSQNDHWLGLPLIDLQDIDDEHWANREVQVIDLEGTMEGDNILHPTDEDIEIIGECIATGAMPGLSYAYVKEVRVFKSITLTGPVGGVELPQSWGFYSADSTLYITPDTSSDVLLQASDYLDDDRFDEDAFKQDDKIFAPDPARTGLGRSCLAAAIHARERMSLGASQGQAVPGHDR